MEAAAQVLPPDDVHYEVVRRLAGLEPFVDFAASDPAARGALLGGCFRVLDTLAARGLDVRALAAGVAAHFGAAAAELDELVRRLARARREHDIDADQPLVLGPYRQARTAHNQTHIFMHCAPGSPDKPVRPPTARIGRV